MWARPGPANWVELRPRKGWADLGPTCLLSLFLFLGSG